MIPDEDTPLRFSRLSGEGWYWCEHSLFYDEHNGESITIPALFMTDGASIPKVFQGLFSKTGKYLFAAILHDYCYKSDFPHDMTRKEVDILFLHYMKRYGVGLFVRYAIFNAVRIGGCGSWKKLPARFHK